MWKNRTPIAIVLALFLVAVAVVPVSAAIKAMTLEELMQISSGAVQGQIISKDVVKLDWADMTDLTFTRLTIRGQELTTGQPVTRELYYMGGVWNGELDHVATAPREHQTRVGANVVAFYWFDSGLTDQGADKIFCYANIYQVQQGAGEPTVIGQGEGAAVSENVKLSVLNAQVKTIHQKLQQQKELEK
jgi:hypothetical protein